MKKSFIIILLVSAFSFGNAQTGINLGANVGFPIGDAGKTSSFDLMLDLAYMYAVSDQVDIGGQIGYDLWIGKDYDFGGTTIKGINVSFIPIVGSIRFHLNEDFFLGGNLGYAIAITKDAKGGLYYEPKIGYSADTFDLFGFYKGISASGGASSAIGVGFMYKFGQN